jgi:lysophospholipase L1-like esterase
VFQSTAGSCYRKMATFLIAGDSWGCGEWVNDSTGYRVIHNGLQQYLDEAGHLTKNVSKGGRSNLVSVRRLKAELFIKSDYDYVIWFQTDPLRDLRPYDKSKFATFTNIDDMLASSSMLLNVTYKFLNTIGVPIYCVGGLSKLNIELMKDYKNLIPMIPSVKELCVPDHCHSNIAFSDWINYISKEFQDFDELISIKHEFDNFFENPSNKVFFWPDGVHPNRYGHKIIFDKLCDTLGLDKKLSN